MLINGAYVTIDGRYIANPDTKETCKAKSKAHFFTSVYRAEDYAATLEEETGKDVSFFIARKNVDFQ